MGKKITSALLLMLLAWLAWKSWQPPETIFGPQRIKVAIPERVNAEIRLWRVVTKRLVWKQAAQAMRQRLRENGLKVITIMRKEAVELHAFDDGRSFNTREDAVRAKKEWEHDGFEASIIKPDDHFGVALGRLYLAAYAQQLQQRLRKSGRRYSYDRHIVNILTWHFTFPAARHEQAERLWRRIQSLGVAEPVLIPEIEFQSTFGIIKSSREDSD